MSRFTNGWVKLHRNILDKDLICNVYLWGIWHALLAMATWKETQILWEGKQKILPPGSVVFGIKELAEQWECSRGVVTKWLRHLESSGRIVLTTCPRGTLVTICNWELYQNNEDVDLINHDSSVRTTCEQRVNSVTLIEEEKNIRKKKEEYIAHSVERAKVSLKFDFESLYSKYPLKLGKQKGLLRCKTEIKTEADYELLSGAITRYTAHCEKSALEPKFIKHFSTFMNCWRDWADAAAGSSALKAKSDLDWAYIFDDPNYAEKMALEKELAE